MSDRAERIAPELEEKLAGIDMEVRAHLEDVDLFDLWWNLGRMWEMELSDLKELVPVSVLRHEGRLYRRVDDAVDDTELADRIKGAARVYAGAQRDFAMLFGLALGQLVTVSRSYPDLDPSSNQGLTPAQVLECWFQASKTVDHFVRPRMLFTEAERSEVDDIVTTKIWGSAEG